MIVRLIPAIVAIFALRSTLSSQEIITKVNQNVPEPRPKTIKHSGLSRPPQGIWLKHPLSLIGRTLIGRTLSSNSTFDITVSVTPSTDATEIITAVSGPSSRNKTGTGTADDDEHMDDVSRDKDNDNNGGGSGDNKNHEDGIWTVNIVVSCNIFLAISALLLNGITMFHYRTETTNLPSILYFRNSLCDSVSAVGFLLQVPSVISVLKENTPVLLPLFSYWICTVAVRMSVFMNCVLGVVRCIKIVSPFYLISRKIVKLSKALYLLAWVAIASLDTWVYIGEISLQNRVYLIKSLILKSEPGFSISSVLAGSSELRLSSFSQGEIVLLQFLPPVVVPALLCLLLVIIQIFHLRRQVPGVTVKETTETQGTRKKNHRNKAATTILLVTTIYVLTTTLSVVVWLVVYKDHLEGWREEKMNKLSWRELAIIYFSSTSLPLVCSILTPLTLLIRGKILYPFLQGAIRKLRFRQN